MLALLDGPDTEIVAILRIAANAGEALFSSFAAAGPIEVEGVWPGPVSIPPQRHWSYGGMPAWWATIGLLVCLQDHARLARMHALGAALPTNAPGIHPPPYFAPLTVAWTDLAVGKANPSAIEEALAAEAWDPSIFAERERPHLLAMRALLAGETRDFDTAMQALFEGLTRRYRMKWAFPDVRLSPIGLALLALARRQGLPAGITSNYAPHLFP
mgnify:FL=1